MGGRVALCASVQQQGEGAEVRSSEYSMTEAER
jgi:hypothetical protein